MHIVGVVADEPALATMNLDIVINTIQAKVIYGHEMTSQVRRRRPLRVRHVHRSHAAAALRFHDLW